MTPLLSNFASRLLASWCLASACSVSTTNALLTKSDVVGVLDVHTATKKEVEALKKYDNTNYGNWMNLDHKGFCDRFKKEFVDKGRQFLEQSLVGACVLAGQMVVEGALQGDPNCNAKVGAFFNNGKALGKETLEKLAKNLECMWVQLISHETEIIPGGETAQFAPGLFTRTGVTPFDEYKHSVYAFVLRDVGCGPRRMKVCPLFMALLPLQRANVIVHELSHLVLGTQDHCYGIQNCRALKEDSAKEVSKLTNADNWAFFCCAAYQSFRFAEVLECAQPPGSFPKSTLVVPDGKFPDTETKHDDDENFLLRFARWVLGYTWNDDEVRPLLHKKVAFEPGAEFTCHVIGVRPNLRFRFRSKDWGFGERSMFIAHVDHWTVKPDGKSFSRIRPEQTTWGAGRYFDRGAQELPDLRVINETERSIEVHESPALLGPVKSDGNKYYLVMVDENQGMGVCESPVQRSRSYFRIVRGRTTIIERECLPEKCPAIVANDSEHRPFNFSSYANEMLKRAQGWRP